MSTISERATTALNILNESLDVEQLISHIKSKQVLIPEESIAMPSVEDITSESCQQLIKHLKETTGFQPEYLPGNKPFNITEHLKGNIENFIGMTQVPTGIIGPLHIIGSAANGDFYVPLATTEGALVASHQRGTKATRLCGGVTSVCLVESVQRSPLFKFKDMGDLGIFLLWTLQQFEVFKIITSQSSKYARLLDMKVNIEGNQLILTFDFYPGDAAGQNMVTFCTDEICCHIIANAPIQPEIWFVESNYSGDKKATASSFAGVRGKKVTAEAHISREVVKNVLKTTPEKVAEYWQSSSIAVIQSGAIGAQGQFANGLAAIYLACGQDVACISESSVGITRMEVSKDSGLYVTVTLPNLMVGTIGGGTALPTQKECLKLLDCSGKGKARKFAEICGALVLCGELSLASALSAGHFTRAHKNLGRKLNNGG